MKISIFFFLFSIYVTLWPFFISSFRILHFKVYLLINLKIRISAICIFLQCFLLDPNIITHIAFHLRHSYSIICFTFDQYLWNVMLRYFEHSLEWKSFYLTSIQWSFVLKDIAYILSYFNLVIFSTIYF